MSNVMETKRFERDEAAIRVSPPLPGPLAARWVEFYMKYAPPSTYIYPFVWDVSQPAQGPFCTDPDGNLFMDFYVHVTAAPLGYNHPEVLRRTGVPFDPIKTADHDTYLAAGPDPQVPCALTSPSEGASLFTVPAHLQERLLEISAPFDFGKVFLVNSGAEANCNAIKIACHWKYRGLRNRLGDKLWGELCHQLGIRPDGFIEGLYEDYPLFGIAFEGAFHGRTLGVLSLTKSKRQHKEGFPSIRWVRHLPYGQLPLPLAGLIESAELRSLIEGRRLASTVFSEGRVPRELLAYIIVEPIQGEGGFIFPEATFLKAIESFARETGTLLICDEVQTGLGRTGHWWASEAFGIRPDIITSAKALRVGAVIGREEVFPEESGVISSTWGGGAMSCAVGAATIDIISSERLLDNARTQGEHLKERLSYLADRCPAVTEVRGLGLMLSLELSSTKLRDRLVKSLFQRGLLTIGCGAKAIRFLPPLDVRKREVDLALEVLEGALKELED